MIATPGEFVGILVVLGFICYVADRLGWWD